MADKVNSNLVNKIKEAKRLVKVGGIYTHFKKPENKYIVVNLGVQEATTEICVIYQALYGDKLIFLRDLNNWLEKVEYNGRKVSRFSLIK